MERIYTVTVSSNYPPPPPQLLLDGIKSVILSSAITLSNCKKPLETFSVLQTPNLTLSHQSLSLLLMVAPVKTPPHFMHSFKNFRFHRTSPNCFYTNFDRTLLLYIRFYIAYTFIVAHSLNKYLHIVVLNFSAPFKTYTNGTTYLVRRQQDPSYSENSWLYDDNPTRPCGNHGPFYRPCPVFIKNIPASEIITLHTFHHIPHYTCPKGLDFLLSRGFKKCPVCKNPHLYFRIEASSIPSTILAQATPPRLPRPQPRRNSRQLNTEE